MTAGQPQWDMWIRRLRCRNRSRSSLPARNAMQRQASITSGLGTTAARRGRLTSPDPLMASAKTSNPQTWNRYTYGLNNPLRFTDPTGLYTCEGTADQCRQFEKTRAGLLKSKDSAAGKAYGKAGENNGVVVRFADKLPDRGGTVAPVDG